MSLINQMLKDLSRRSVPVTDPDIILSGLTFTSQTSSQKKNYYILFATGAGLIFIIMLSLLIKVINTNDQENSPALGAFQSSSAISLKKITQPDFAIEISPAILSSIVLQIKNEVSSLQLLLDHNVLYRITQNQNGQLIIVLENTRLAADLPQVDTVNSTIKNILALNQPDGNLKMIINLQPGAELKRLELSDTEKPPIFNIELFHHSVEPLIQNQEVKKIGDDQSTSVKKMSRETIITAEYQQALRLIEQGQTQEAMILLEDFLQRNPKYMPARKSYTTLLLEEGKLTEAQQIIDVGLQQLPSYPPYVQLKAQILVNLGKLNQALDLLLKSPPNVDKNPDYHAFIAALYQRTDKFALAEKVYENLLKIQPENSIWWMGLGIARDSLKKSKSALYAYLKANSSENLTPELKIYVENRIHMLS